MDRAFEVQTNYKIMKPIHPTKPANMSDKAFKSMVARNNMTTKSLTALAASIERGKVK